MESDEQWKQTILKLNVETTDRLGQQLMSTCRQQMLQRIKGIHDDKNAQDEEDGNQSVHDGQGQLQSQPGDDPA